MEKNSENFVGDYKLSKTTKQIDNLSEGKNVEHEYRPFAPYTLYVHIITAPSSPLALLSARTSIIGKVGLPGTKVV